MKTHLFIAFIIAALLVYYFGSRFFDRVEATLSTNVNYKRLELQISSLKGQVEDLHQRLDLEPQLRDAARLECMGDQMTRYWVHHLEQEYERVLNRRYPKPSCESLLGSRN